jgi:hypothetical protein
MTNGSPPDDRRTSAEQLIAELRAFTDEEAEQLDALANELVELRSTAPAPSFDRAAIWERIADRIESRDR